MDRYEYAVIPAPGRAEKVRGAKTTAERFAATLTQVMNQLGAEGWEYVRAETLPCEERKGFTGRQVTVQNLLVFRRVIAPVPAPAPAPVVQPQAAGLRAAWDDEPTVLGPLVGPATPPAAAPQRGTLVGPPVINPGR